jgi:hypothetical protein
LAPGIAETFGGVAGEDDFQRERPNELVEAESWRRQREPAEAESAGRGRECWATGGVRDSEREGDEVSGWVYVQMRRDERLCVFSLFRSRVETVFSKPFGIRNSGRLFSNRL